MKKRQPSGPRAGAFPDTRPTIFEAISSEDESLRAAGMERLARAYWMPVYKYIRLKWGKAADQSEDLTQAFFAAAIEKNFFQKFDPAKARFKTYLRVCLDAFILDDNKSTNRLKRGGGLSFHSLDFEDAERQLDPAALFTAASPEDYIQKEWIRSLYTAAVSALREQLTGAEKEIYFRLFERYLLNDAEEGPRAAYAELATEFSLPVTTVTNHLSFARREFRRNLLEKLREFTLDDEEYRKEARSLFGLES